MCAAAMPLNADHQLYVDYANGYGAPLGRVQGAGYVNELVARLSGRPVIDETTTNRTLNRDNATFPFDRPLYADFTHGSSRQAEADVTSQTCSWARSCRRSASSTTTTARAPIRGGRTRNAHGSRAR